MFFLLIKDVIEKYLWYALEVRGFAHSTLKSRKIYLVKLECWLRDKEIVDICTVNNADIDEYHAWYSKQINRRGTLNTTATVNESLKATKVLLTWCINYLNLDLKVKPTEIRLRRVPEKMPEIITFNEVRQVINHWRVEQDCLMIALQFEAGLRIEELRDVQVDQFKGTTLHIVGKGSKHRITFVSHELKQRIDKWLDKNCWESGHVFRPLRHGKCGIGYECQDTMRARIQKAFAETLSRKMHPHQLRHAFALNLLENGCSLRSIQKLLGHSNIETTMRYLNVTDKFLEKNYRECFGGSVYNPLNIAKK